jgi:hypothetical protein
MHLKTNNYAVNEITEKRTLSKSSKKSMSSSSRQRSVSLVQIVSSQINNAFDVLKNRSNSRIKSELTFTQKTKNAQTQFTFKLRDRLSNSRKTTKSTQNEELWRRSRLYSYCSTTYETKRMTRWYLFWSIRKSKNMIYWFIQKFWRNVCVSTSYNSFNIDFHLLYQKSKNVRTCFYVNFRLNVNHWLIIFASKNVCFFRIRTANDRWINVHNVYSVSFSSYASISTLFVIETIKRQLNDEKKHIILRNFNLHHFLWSDSARSTQHDAIDQLLDVVHQIQLRLTLSSSTITWKTRNLCNIINLIFMFEELQKKLIHCMIRSKLNQSSDHI